MTTKQLKDRWDKYPAKKLSGGLFGIKDTKSPFGLTEEGYEDFRGIHIEDTLKKANFMNADFSYASFGEMSRIYNCAFFNVLFYKADMQHFSEHANLFKKCVFDQCKFNFAYIGGGSSQYENCLFIKNKFYRTTMFKKPEFYNCIFENNRLKGVDFSVAYFENCKFIGDIVDVPFRGDDPSGQSGEFKKNIMKNIDFSHANLSWIGFTGGIPLNDIKLPSDKNIIFIEDMYSIICQAYKNLNKYFYDEKERNIASEILQEYLSDVGVNNNILQVCDDKLIEIEQTQEIYNLNDIMDYHDVDCNFIDKFRQLISDAKEHISIRMK